MDTRHGGAEDGREEADGGQQEVRIDSPNVCKEDKGFASRSHSASGTGANQPNLPAPHQAGGCCLARPVAVAVAFMVAAANAGEQLSCNI